MADAGRTVTPSRRSQHRDQFPPSVVRQLENVLGETLAPGLRLELEMFCHRFRAQSSSRPEPPQVQFFVNATEQFILAWRQLLPAWRVHLSGMGEDQTLVEHLERVMPSLKRIVSRQRAWRKRSHGRPSAHRRRRFLFGLGQILARVGIRATRARTGQLARLARVLMPLVGEPHVTDFFVELRDAVDEIHLHEGLQQSARLAEATRAPARARRSAR